MIKIGIIGCGAIGTSIANAVKNKFQNQAYIAFVSDVSKPQIQKFKKTTHLNQVKVLSFDELIKQSDFVIEAATQSVAKQIIPEALKQNKNILVLSVGGILQIKNLQQIFQKSKAKIYIPTGAIAGIDGLLASRTSRIKKVEITTRKPLKGLSGAPYFMAKGFDASKIKKPTLIFKGKANDAIKYFPQNVNVAATLSLAGIGPEKTKVSIYTSPTYTSNVHEILIESDYGTIEVKVTNVPSKDNPKTSGLAIGSAIATVEKMLSQIKVGT